MYIVIHTDKNEEMMRALFDAIKNNHETYLYSLDFMEKRGYQLRLHGDKDEASSNLFAKNFIKNYKKQ